MGTYLVAFKAEAKGGKGGNQWDDGYDFQDVTKIHVRGGLEGIQFIKFEYVKAGKTVAGPIHGVSGPGFTQTFEIKNSEKEILLSVEGYYNESTGVMQSIQFITNKKTSDVIGYEEGTKFSLRASRSKIIGFHGFAEKNLNSLGAYFLRMPSIKSGIEGGQTTGKGYDDGGDYDGIRKVYVTSDGSAIRHVRFDYVNTGQVETRERGVKIGTQEEFEVNHPYEYITSVEGTYAVTQPYGCIVLTSLTFKTSNGRASPIIGKVTGTKFVLQNNGNAIVGFHGRVGSCVDGIGAYYFPLPPPPQGEGSDGAHFIQTPAIKSVIEGGQTTGKNYDDGGDYDGIRKVFVTSDGAAIRYVRFDYDKAGQVDTRERGEKVGTQHEFTVEHPNEYITSVEGTYAVTQPYGCIVLTSLTFKTSKGKTSPAIGKVTGTKFKLESQGDAIVGFHGRVGSCVDGIGAYYAAFPRSPPKPAPAPAPAPNPAPDPAPAPAPAPAPTPAPPVDTDSSPQKVEAQGGKGGNKWDDGADHDGVTKIHVIYGVAVEQIRFDYVKNGHPKEGTFHGIKGNRSFTYTLEVNHPDEYILSVNGCYDSSNIIQGIEFKTNTQTFNYIGSDEGTQFSLEVKDKKIIGFHGFADTHLNSLGAYFTPTTN